MDVELGHKEMNASVTYVPMRVTVPGGVAFATSALESANAFLYPTIVDVCIAATIKHERKRCNTGLHISSCLKKLEDGSEQCSMATSTPWGTSYVVGMWG